jgi:hypothetical protein
VEGHPAPRPIGRPYPQGQERPHGVDAPQKAQAEGGTQAERINIARLTERAAVLDEIERTVLQYQDKGLLGALIMKITLMRRAGAW